MAKLLRLLGYLLGTASFLTTWFYGGRWAGSATEWINLLGLLLLLIPVVPAIIGMAVWSLFEGCAFKLESAASEAKAAVVAAERKRETQQVDAAIASKMQALAAAGDIVSVAGSGNKLVRCSNNHRYMLSSFFASRSAVERDRFTGEYYTEQWGELACPSCETNLLAFEDSPSVMYVACDACRHLWRYGRYSSCPSCAARAKRG